MKIIALYMKEIKNREIESKKNGESLEHALWMLTEMVTMVEPLRITRWLGFVQGILYKEGVYTMEEMNQHSKEMLVPDLRAKKLC